MFKTSITRRVGSTGELDSIFGEVDRLLGSTFNGNIESFRHGNYPPFNVLESSVEVAVAGFKKEELKVRSEDGMLYISGQKEEKSDKKYISKGISEKSFKLAFKIPKYGRIGGCTLVDGILTVNLYTVVPDEMKPIDIEIQ